MGALSSWKTLVRTLNLIISAKSLLPYKVVFAGSGGQDLDVFGRGMTQPATGDVSGLSRKDREQLDLPLGCWGWGWGRGRHYVWM